MLWPWRFTPSGYGGAADMEGQEVTVSYVTPEISPVVETAS